MSPSEREFSDNLISAHYAKQLGLIMIIISLLVSCHQPVSASKLVPIEPTWIKYVASDVQVESKTPFCVVHDSNYSGSFKEDGLVICCKDGKCRIPVYSSYGHIELSTVGMYILTITGHGRGTSARTEYLSIFASNGEELARVRKSYWVTSSISGKVDPDLVELKSKIYKSGSEIFLQMYNGDLIVSELKLHVEEASP